MGDEDGGTDTLVATTGGMRQLRQGQSVVARIPEQAVHLFDRASGEALSNRELREEAVADPDLPQD
jgi:multiple sugar transport system ATP-binding protein